MNTIELQSILTDLLAKWESEVVEFKEASDSFSTQDIGKYFSALSNEANLRGAESAWLVLGVNNKSRAVVGTDYREDKDRLMSLKHQIAQTLSPSTSFKDIHVLHAAQGRVVLFQIPAAPRGMPIAWNSICYGRNGESLVGLSISKQDEIRSQGAAEDWSAVPCKNADISHLDPAALQRAREILMASQKDADRKQACLALSATELLDKLELRVGEHITRAALLLLGKPFVTTLLSPFVAELTWKLEGTERNYEHFAPLSYSIRACSTKRFVTCAYLFCRLAS
jgi:ATP-dependent DNA helicase RecG